MRYLDRMAKTSAKSILSRIDKRLKALAPPKKKKLSDRAASTMAGLPEDAIGTIRKQINSGRQTGFRVETIEKLAAGLQTSARWLLHEEGPENVAEPEHLDSEDVLPPAVEGPTVPVAGYVSAGAEAKFIPLPVGELDRVAAPPGSNKQTQCLQVRGSSLGELFDRWLIFYDDIRSPITADLIGRLCVVGLSDDRVVVKKIQRERGEYILLSNTEPPMRDVIIVWAAKVRDMRPQ